MGFELAEDILGLLREGTFRRIDCHFRTVLADPKLYSEQTLASFYEPMAEGQDNSPFYRSAARRIMTAIQEGTVWDRIPHCIVLWYLDDKTRLVAMEGEVSTQYSLLIKKLLQSYMTLTLGYTNGVCSYVPTSQMIIEGGYEATCNYFFNLRGKFVPEIENIIIGQIAKLDIKLKLDGLNH